MNQSILLSAAKGGSTAKQQHVNPTVVPTVFPKKAVWLFWKNFVFKKNVEKNNQKHKWASAWSKRPSRSARKAPRMEKVEQTPQRLPAEETREDALPIASADLQSAICGPTPSYNVLRQENCDKVKRVINPNEHWQFFTFSPFNV